MIPSSRLIWLTAILGFPATLADALLPSTRPAALAILAALGIAALLDALIRRRPLTGIRVELPGLTRMFEGRDAQLPIRIHNARGTAHRLRVGFAAPNALALDPEDQWLDLPPGAALSQIAWACTPRRRGTHRVDACFLESSSPLGLWTVRLRQTVASEIRIYPDLRDEDALKALRRGSENLHVTRQIGRGREFEKLREYSPGDSSDEIHWKAAARRGRPITKVFQVERTQEVYLVIDASRLSGRIMGDEPALEKAIQATLTLGAITERRGDLLGVAAFAGQVEAFVRAGRGKAHYAACRDAINNLRTRPVSPDFEEIATLLRLRLRRRALIVFLTALDDPILAAHFERATRPLSRRHLVMAAMLRPASAEPLFHEPEIESADDIYRALAGHLGWGRLRELQGALARQGVRLSLLEPSVFAASLVRLYDDVKQRQLL